jgi:hypothetical protein
VFKLSVCELVRAREREREGVSELRTLKRVVL